MVKTLFLRSITVVARESEQPSYTIQTIHLHLEMKCYMPLKFMNTPLKCHILFLYQIAGLIMEIVILTFLIYSQFACLKIQYILQDRTPQKYSVNTMQHAATCYYYKVTGCWRRNLNNHLYLYLWNQWMIIFQIEESSQVALW